MQRVVIDEPYEFVPPYRGRFWSWAFRYYLPRYLRRSGGIVESECRGLDLLRESVQQGHGILLCPNHCRPSDPMAMGLISRETGLHVYSMASWHVFKQSWLQAFLTRRFGAFSIYREGTDRLALNTAIEIVTSAERPLVVFPEGVISRCNDHLGALMDGTAFIARAAAKKRVKANPDAQVVIHPVALRYQFLGDIEATVSPVLDDIEHRLTWAPDLGGSLVDRVRRVGRALLALKEIEFMGSAQPGDTYDRIEKLIDTILAPMEEEWCGGVRTGSVVSRVKTLRTSILPDLVNGSIKKRERRRRWSHLARMYLAQQLGFYPRNYITEDSPPERILETVERFEEDLTDEARVHPPLRLIIEVGKPIPVPTARVRGESDPVMDQLRDDLVAMLDRLRLERPPARSS